MKKSMPKELYLVYRNNTASAILKSKIGNIKNIRARLVLEKEAPGEEDIIYSLGEARLLQKQINDDQSFFDYVDLNQTHIIGGYLTSNYQAFYRIDNFDAYQSIKDDNRYFLGKYIVTDIDIKNVKSKEIFDKSLQSKTFYKDVCNKNPLFKKITNSYIAINEKQMRSIIEAELKRMGIKEISLEKREIFIA